MKIILGLYLISWIYLYIASEHNNPMVAFRKSLKHRGLIKTIIFHLIIPIMYLNAFLQIITNYIEEFIDWLID